jgi:hypothetical protein
MNNPAPTSAEQAAFEAWAEPQGFDLRRPNKSYLNTVCDYAWQGWQARAAMQTAEPVNVKAIAKAAFDQVITDSCEDGDAQTNEDFYSGKVAGILAMKMAVEQSQAGPDRAPSIAPEASDADTLSALLWLYHRLPHGYERQEHIERTIKALAAKTGTDVESCLTERAPSIDSAADAKDWRNVDECLPEFDVPVWLFEPGRNIWIGARSHEVEGWLWGNCYGAAYSRPDGTWDSDTNECDDDYQPTHWMPLPGVPAIAALQPEGE